MKDESTNLGGPEAVNRATFQTELDRLPRPDTALFPDGGLKVIE